MIETSFLDKIAQKILADFQHKMTSLVVVLPNKRAKVFLIEALRKQSTETIFAPSIISIEELIQDIAGIRAIDPIELLFEFYEVYCTVSDKAALQTFEIFANWAKTLLQDFNEIDRYLLEPNKVLKYLENIKEIEHWSVDVGQRTELIGNYLEFWQKLPLYYESLYDHLRQKGIGYQGLIYREAVYNINHFSNARKEQHLLFAGFNALNAAEEQIIQHLMASGQAGIYWDADMTFLNNSFHDAGLFLRRFKESWKHYKSHPFEWIFDDFSKTKNIEVIGTPKSIGQTKIAGSIIAKTIEDNPNVNLDRVAIILGEENMLLPLLHALPETVGALNITMGYSAKNNPAQILIAKLFRMHVNALARNSSNYVFYYKDVLDVLGNPLIEPYLKSNTAANAIRQNNYTFITHKKLFELNGASNPLFDLLFQKWENGPIEALEILTKLLNTVNENLTTNNETEKITKTFIYALFKLLNKLSNYYLKHHHIDNVETLYVIYKQVIDLAEVSFEGEPLSGLQIMGVLESRVLDFETVIVTSMNEGKFPAGKSLNSFIPYDVKKELGLPTFKEKDAIYTYHFYHLLQRAKNIYLIYNTESEGLDAGEKSRFITQLEVEKQANHILTHDIYHPELPETVYTPMVIPKSDSVMKRLGEIAQNGFSPSALTSYIRNPLAFYFQKILRISEAKEVEENIALNTLGTIIHETLKTLYDPLIGKYLTESDIEGCFSNLDSEVLRQFKLVYKEGEIKKGRNLLAFEVAKRNISNFLKMELETIRKGAAIKILFLEARFERDLLHNDLPFPVKIGGSVDRIEEHNGKIRIIDYKTGKVEAAGVTLKSWSGLTADIKTDKIIQLLAYAFMYELHADGKEIEAGIISFKNLKSGFLPFVFKGTVQKAETNIVTKEVAQQYIDELVELLKEIFNPDIPFTEKVI